MLKNVPRLNIALVYNLQGPKFGHASSVGMTTSCFKICRGLVLTFHSVQWPTLQQNHSVEGSLLIAFHGFGQREKPRGTTCWWLVRNRGLHYTVLEFPHSLLTTSRIGYAEWYWISLNPQQHYAFILTTLEHWCSQHCYCAP